MKTNTLTIEKMVNGGYGLARNSEGRVVFIQNCLPGEVVDCSRFEQRKKTLFGVPKKIIREHTGRISPPCPYYGSCGGCSLQHADYKTQLAVKEQILEDLLGTVFQPSRSCVPSPQQFGYRQRIRLQVQENNLGFKRFRSHEVIAVKACLLAHHPINSVMASLLSDSRTFRLFENSAGVEFLFNPETTSVSLLFHCQRKPRPAELTTATELVQQTTDLENIYFTGTTFSRMGPYPENAPGLHGNRLSSLITTTTAVEPFRLNWEVGGFCQVNLPQNEQLIEHVLQCCKPDSSRQILDLFCGMGNFSIPLAQLAGSVIGVEGQGASIREARKNSDEAGLTNTKFIKGDIGGVCDKFIEEGRHFDITVADPPRQGVAGLWSKIAGLTDHRLIYVSCDPATLVRDIHKLKEHNFHPISLVPFDMFPQTHHIETVTVFEKNCRFRKKPLKPTEKPYNLLN